MNQATLHPVVSREQWLAERLGFGRVVSNSIDATAASKASASFGFHDGQSGNSWFGMTKYSGSALACVTSTHVDSSRKPAHRGADT